MSSVSWAAEPGPTVGPTPGFLPGAAGLLFSLYHSPQPRVAPRGGILYIHPFAEELNKARRMAALQARRFAAAGFAVLLPDMYGCGDSEGEFGDARWELWQTDLRLCLEQLRARSRPPFYLWGLRTGALLATALARRTPVDGLLLWQPVAEGRVFLQQLLRLRLAAGLFGGEPKETLAELRSLLAAGRTLEIAGYELHPALAAALEQARLAPPTVTTPVHWLELTDAQALPPASSRIVEQWRAAGLAVSARAVAGEPFWATTEISYAPALLEASVLALTTPA